MIGLPGALLRSRAACSVLAVAAVLGGFFVWHKVDRSGAVRRAVVEYVAKVELASSRAELEELKRRHAVAAGAAMRLQTEIEKAFAEAEAAEQELEHYVSTVEDSCVVEPGLVERLRNR
ncbi:hypothetical protein [Roseibium marinum]|uniref:Uncharacterized protein n=1 Tax=Roseibium marinum TaxID=281252 RepID=A0A2S3UPD9_9HYPH|nr:hypothetical protein [Roseibium marinum]POF29588.1 hypothetical protein CLV41_10811 [Roseibium marinum]